MLVPVIMYFLLISCVTLFIYSKHRWGSSAPKTVSIKAVCTTLIVLAAVIGLARYWHGEAFLFPFFITAGLIFGLVGDITICQSAPGGFFSGMVFFALGHLSYIAAFICISKHLLWSIPLFLLVYLVFLILFRKSRLQPGKLLIPTIIYAAVITAMVSISFTLPFSVEKGFILFAGAVLFAVSDSLLAINSFSTSNSLKSDVFGLCCYFLGQSFFALSISVILF